MQSAFAVSFDGNSTPCGDAGCDGTAGGRTGFPCQMVNVMNAPHSAQHRRPI
jgi:hypothetical protein